MYGNQATELMSLMTHSIGRKYLSLFQNDKDFRRRNLTATTYWTVSSKPPICWITQFFHCLRTLYIIIFGESFSVTVPSGKKKSIKKLLGKILIDHALIFKNFKFDLFHAILLIINLSNSWWMMYFSPLFKELWDYSLKVTWHIQ